MKLPEETEKGIKELKKEVDDLTDTINNLTDTINKEHAKKKFGLGYQSL